MVSLCHTHSQELVQGRAGKLSPGPKMAHQAGLRMIASGRARGPGGEFGQPAGSVDFSIKNTLRCLPAPIKERAVYENMMVV